MVQYSENHLLLRFGGPAWADQEEWSCGLRLAAPNDNQPANLLDLAQEIIEDVAQLCVEYVQRSTSGFSGTVRITTVDLNPIAAATGKYLFPNTPVELEVPSAGSGLAAGYPQIAYAVTLRGSLYRRGPAARGRWYVPMSAAPEYQPTNTGVLPSATATALAQSAGTFLSSLAQLAGPTDPVAVTPWLFGDGIGGPRDSPIEECFVGNVVDTQRRRRNSIEETYFPGGYDPIN